MRHFINLTQSIETLLLKGRGGLVYRTDLPFHKPDGSLGYRRGWVLPQDAKVLDKHKKAGGFADQMTHIKVQQQEMFDDGEGEAWGERVDAKKREDVPNLKDVATSSGIQIIKELKEGDGTHDAETFTPAVAAGGDKYTPDRVDAYQEIPQEKKFELAKSALEKEDWSGIPIDPVGDAAKVVLKMVQWCVKSSPDGSIKGFNIKGWQNAKVRDFLKETGVANPKGVNTFQTAFGTIVLRYSQKLWMGWLKGGFSGKVLLPHKAQN